MGKFSNFIDKHRNVDKTYWILFIILVAISIIALFTSSSTIINKAIARGENPLSPIGWQIFFLFLGVVLAYLIQFVPSKHYRIIGYATFIIGLLFLLLNAAHIGITANGATRWIKVGPITIQSSELAKLGLIIVSADLLTRITDEQSKKTYFYIVLGLTLATCFLIMIGNLSTAILLGFVLIIIMFLGKINISWLAALCTAVLVFLVCGYLFVKKVYIDQDREITGIMGRASTWVSRIDNKLKEIGTDDSEIKLTDDNYQATLARVAVARGGKSPLGVLPGNSLERNYLPLANADYIFAIIVEETGFLGALALCFLYLSILFRACLTSSKYTDYSAQLMVMGLGLMLTIQALFSMMVAVGLFPVTGQPLPLITKGGTSAIITSLYFGIMMGVSREQKEINTQVIETIQESQEDIPDIEVE